MKTLTRRDEQDAFKHFYSSKKAELLIIYGRRGLGKTQLVEGNFLLRKNNLLKITGEKSKSSSDHISEFFEKVKEIFKDDEVWGDEPVKKWQQAFKNFTRIINSTSKTPLDFRMRGNVSKNKTYAIEKSSKASSKNKKIILFFDELPWLYTKNSDLLLALECFWNQFWAQDKRIKLIISGSDGAWILDKIINNKKGLGKYVSQIIALEPFNLKETKKFVAMRKDSKSPSLSPKQIAEVYMAIGGVPQYLSKLPKAATAPQLIEKFFFTKNNFILQEFEGLLASLFVNPKIYFHIIKAIAAHPFGISQENIFKKLPQVSKGIGGLTKLRALEEAGLIRSCVPIYHNRKGIFYKINDPLVLFYLFWLEPLKKQLLKSGLNKNYWEKLQTTSKWQRWAAQAFELMCHKHTNQIAEGLKLSPDATPASWRYAPAKIEQGSQIDLLFESEGAIVLCEIAYSPKPIMIDKDYAAQLKAKIAIFQKITRIKKPVSLAFITANGIKKTLYSEAMLMGFVTLKDFFK